MRRLWAVLLVLILLAAGAVNPARARADSLPDYEFRSGRFYTQTGQNAAGLFGYAVTDDDGVPMFQQLQALGGVDTLGYPISGRFSCGGFTCQAMQRAILQWRPDLGQAVPLNVFDEMSAAGLDAWLLENRQIPPAAGLATDGGPSWQQTAATPLSILDQDPAIQAFYWLAADPVTLYGLPVSYADFGDVTVVRAQRAAFQHWKVETLWAMAGEITLANAGDIAKESGFIPQEALLPQPAPVAELRAAVGGVRLDVDVPEPAVAQIVNTAHFAVAEIIVQSTGRGGQAATAFGTGVVFDGDGYLLTNNHVVEGARLVLVRMHDGRTFGATVVAASPARDLAVVRAEARDLPALPLGNSDEVVTGETVVGLGFGLVLPMAPNAKVGQVTAVGRLVPQLGPVLPFSLIQTDVPLSPGDSGGPLLNLRGEVVGLNMGRTLSHAGPVEFRGLSIPINEAHSFLAEVGLADQATGATLTPYGRRAIVGR